MDINILYSRRISYYIERIVSGIKAHMPAASLL